MDESWRNLALILGAGGYGAAVGSVRLEAITQLIAPERPAP